MSTCTSTRRIGDANRTSERINLDTSATSVAAIHGNADEGDDTDDAALGGTGVGLGPRDVRVRRMVAPGGYTLSPRYPATRHVIQPDTLQYQKTLSFFFLESCFLNIPSPRRHTHSI